MAPDKPREQVTELRARRMTCGVLVDFVTEYLESALPEGERRRFAAHIATCPGCATYLEQMHLTLGAVGRLREEDVPPRAIHALLDAFRDRA